MLLLLFVGGGEAPAASFLIFEHAQITGFADVGTTPGFEDETDIAAPADIGIITGNF